mmetsp:Transcript_2143/g.9728  ORF Transcript_2143/g.9728 Transcript_2143/m.9728 type:complete len:234 (-) Transcript_2143:1111-1812(-)
MRQAVRPHLLRSHVGHAHRRGVLIRAAGILRPDPARGHRGHRQAVEPAVGMAGSAEEGGDAGGTQAGGDAARGVWAMEDWRGRRRGVRLHERMHRGSQDEDGRAGRCRRSTRRRRHGQHRTARRRRRRRRIIPRRRRRRIDGRRETRTIREVRSQSTDRTPAVRASRVQAPVQDGRHHAAFHLRQADRDGGLGVPADIRLQTERVGSVVTAVEGQSEELARWRRERRRASDVG